MSATNDEEQEQFLNVLKSGLYNQLNDEERLDVYELEQLNERAEGLLKLFYKSTIEFQANGAFYNRSKMSEQPTSGEYLQDKKRLLLEWETADKNELKLVKITGDVLVLKDNLLKIGYYYKKLEQEEMAEKAARLKKEREQSCPIPDKARIEAEKKEIEKLNKKFKNQ